MHITLIGLGNMGSPIGQHLCSAGHQLRAFDLSAAALTGAQSWGATRCNSIADAVADAEIIFTSLPNPADVEAVAMGDDGIAAHAPRNAIHVDLSTNAPDTIVRIGAALAERQVALLDAPVSGGVVGAKRGTLTIMVGGEAEPFERALPALECFARSVTHVGELGCGATAKLVNNLIACNNVATAAEAFRLGSAAGIDSETLDAVIRSSSGDSIMYRAVAKKFLQQDWSANFALDLAAKDMQLAAQLAQQHKVPLRLGAQTAELLQMAKTMGLGQDDLAALLRVYESQSER